MVNTGVCASDKVVWLEKKLAKRKKKCCKNDIFWGQFHEKYLTNSC